MMKRFQRFPIPKAYHSDWLLYLLLVLIFYLETCSSASKKTKKLPPDTFSDVPKIPRIAGAVFQETFVEPVASSPMNPFIEMTNCFKQNFKRSGGIVKHPYIGYSIPKIIKAHGYPVEDIEVTTEDGYILHVFRIPYSDKSPRDPKIKKKPIYMNHGMGSNAQEFLLQWGNRNLAMLLADSGFDVFLPNARGTSYSSKHVNKTWNNDEDASYWDFSFDEMGRYDVPAVLNMILEKTSSDQAYYVGHSLGTTEYFVALSERPELNSKITAAFLFTPTAILTNTQGFFKDVAPLSVESQKHYLDKPIFIGNGGKKPALDAKKSLNDFCTPSEFQCVGCSNLYLMITGYASGSNQTNHTEIPYLVSLFPDNIGSKTMYHYFQIVLSNRFRPYDYKNTTKNRKRYGSSLPKDYDLSKITAPTIFFYAKHDKITVPKDIEKLATKLGPGSVKKMFLVPDPTFNHIEFATAIQAKEMVYDYIVEYMQTGIYDNKPNS